MLTKKDEDHNWLEKGFNPIVHVLLTQQEGGNWIVMRPQKLSGDVHGYITDDKAGNRFS